MLTFSVPCSWDDSLLSTLTELAKQGAVSFELFGSLRQSTVGSAHSAAAIRGRCQTREQVEAYVDKIHAAGFTFNYAINSTCLGGQEYDKEGHKKLLDELAWIASFADRVIVAVPYLMELIRLHFPNLLIVTSVADSVNSVRKARFFENMGVSRITLDYMSNRNFALLAEIRKSVSCDLELLVNDGCLLHCPYREYHFNLGSHGSHRDDSFYLDYPIFRCCVDRMRDLSELVKIPWIRPEDLAEYLGVTTHFKIAGREKPNAWIENCVRAYVSQHYDGNFFDLVTIVTPASHEVGRMFLGDPPAIHLDNRQLDGFIERFKAHACLNCETCHYCEAIARRTISVDQQDLERYMRKAEEGLSLLVNLENWRDGPGYHLARLAYKAYINEHPIWRFIRTMNQALFSRTTQE